MVRRLFCKHEWRLMHERFATTKAPYSWKCFKCGKTKKFTGIEHGEHAFDYSAAQYARELSRYFTDEESDGI